MKKMATETRLLKQLGTSFTRYSDTRKNKPSRRVSIVIHFFKKGQKLRTRRILTKLDFHRTTSSYGERWTKVIGKGVRC